MIERKPSRQERERIRLIQTVIQCAEDLFGLNGYENTTIDAIAVNSEYSKRTIYKHFACKEDLYFAVLLQGHMRLLDAIRAQIVASATAYDNIRRAYRAFYDFYTNNGWLFDLMTGIKAIKSAKAPSELPYFEKYANHIGLLYKEILGLFAMAQQDKSIRTDIDARQLGFSSTFILQGFFHTLSLMGDSFTNHFGLDRDRFTEQTMELLFELLEEKAND